MDAALCAKKLPAVISSLMGVFASSQKSVIQEAGDSLLKLIENSVTEGLIAQTEAALNSKVPKKQRALTPLENIVNTVEGGLSPRYQSSWDDILLLIASLYEVRTLLSLSLPFLLSLSHFFFFFLFF